MTLLSQIVGLSMCVLALTSALNTHANQLKISKNVENRVTAEAFATELLEFFHSMDESDLAWFNGLQKTSQAPFGNSLCAKVNIKDPMSGVIVNPDGIGTIGFGRNEYNRFYQIQVVELATMKTQDDLCLKYTEGPEGAGFKYTPRPNDGFAFQVTVGVIWRSGTDSDRIVLTTVLQDR